MNHRKIRGRGIGDNPSGRYEEFSRESVRDDIREEDAPDGAWKTQLHVDHSKSIISTNDSPDVPFNHSINPYRGCEHGCVYCFARPSHAWLGYSPGLDFETQIIYKPDAAKLLQACFEKNGYRCDPIAIGANTDAYQPAERKLLITRQLLEVFERYRHPVSLITKSSLIERDMDLLSRLAADNLVAVNISICTQQARLSRAMEPRAAAPKRRMETIKELSDNGVPVNLLVAPVIPVLNDGEMESIMEQARQAGARSAGYVLLRLPHELKTLFVDWLGQQYPLKANHVMQRMKDCRGGREYNAEFSQRMQGKGAYADLIHHRFELAYRRFGFEKAPALNTALFRSPASTQLTLF